jgi:hypothetical protein
MAQETVLSHRPSSDTNGQSMQPGSSPQLCSIKGSPSRTPLQVQAALALLKNEHTSHEGKSIAEQVLVEYITEEHA